VTRLGEKIRIAPLEPARLARIEEQVVAAGREALRAPAPRRPRRLDWRLGAAAAGLAAAAVVLFAVGRGQDGARLEIDGAVVELAAGSRVAAGTRADGATVLDLARGRVDCEVEPRPHRAPFVVQAGDVAVEVVGTIFSVEREERGEVRVRVTRGAVRVAAAGRRPVVVSAGQSWTRGAGEERPLVGDRRPATGDRGPATEDRGPATEDRGPATEDRRPAAGPEENRPVSPGPASEGRPTPTPGLAPEFAGTQLEENRPVSPAPRPDEERGGAGARGSIAAADPAPAAAHGWPPRACDDAAACQAIALHETGPEAGQALYSLVYLEVFAGGDPRRAITLADLYERRFARRRPAEAEAVLWLRVLAHRKAGEAEREREAAERYLEHHPRGRFSAQATRLVDRDR
jgi:hypothetical protein